MADATEARASMLPGSSVTKGVTLVKPLGAGGMGAVWLADHSGLQTRVIVKFMLATLDGSASARSRFSREAAAAAQVKSPHVVQMFDHGVTDEGVPFIVMEYLEGKNLGEHMNEHGALSPRETVTIITQVAKALSRVHAANLLHRDIKPENIYLCDGEDDVFVKLLDFGIAKSHTADALDGETKTGQVVGTPYYMSPEQVKADKNIDLRADLWALAIVTFEALTGQRPFDGPSFGALAVAIATGEPLKCTELNPALGAPADAWFAKALARDPNHRFANAREFAEALRVAFEGVIPASQKLSPMSSSGPATSTPDPSMQPVDSEARTVEVGAPFAELDSALSIASGRGQMPSASGLARSEPGVVPPMSSASVVAERKRGRSWLVAMAVIALAAGGGIAWIALSGPGRSTNKVDVARVDHDGVVPTASQIAATARPDLGATAPDAAAATAAVASAQSSLSAPLPSAKPAHHDRLGVTTAKPTPSQSAPAPTPPPSASGKNGADLF